MYTEAQVLDRIRQAIANSVGGQRAFARHCGLSEQYICDLFKGRRHLTPKLLQAVGLKKVVGYVALERNTATAANESTDA